MGQLNTDLLVTMDGWIGGMWLDFGCIERGRCIYCLPFIDSHGLGQ